MRAASAPLSCLIALAILVPGLASARDLWSSETGPESKPGEPPKIKNFFFVAFRFVVFFLVALRLVALFFVAFRFVAFFLVTLRFLVAFFLVTFLLVVFPFFAFFLLRGKSTSCGVDLLGRHPTYS